MLIFVYDFWKKHPALLLGILVLLGTASALAWHPIYFVVFITAFLPYLFKRSFFLSLICALAVCALAYSNAAWRTASCRSCTDTIVGKGIFHIEDLSLFSSPFHRCYCYKGILKQFQSEEGIILTLTLCSKNKI